MRIVIARGGRTEPVEVDLERGTVTIAGREHPFTVVAPGAMRTEIDIAGERAVVDGWPSGLPAPPGPVDVNGERWTLERVELEAGPRARATPPTPAGPAPGDPSDRSGGPGIPILPPMPGKAIEVRVREGDRVRQGQVLLVLEAMKMRNEVASPSDGRVERLSVRAGANVRANEPMLFVVPGTG